MSARLLWRMLVMSALLALVGWRIHGWWYAHRERVELEQRLGRATALVREREQLRAAPATAAVAGEGSTDVDVFTLVHKALSAVHLPAAALRESTPEGEGLLLKQESGLELRRQTVRVTLEPVTIKELGHFCQQWRAANPIWDMTRIELTSVFPSSSEQPSGVTTSGSFRAVIALRATIAEIKAARVGTLENQRNRSITSFTER